MHVPISSSAAAICLAILTSSAAIAQHRVLLQGKDRLAVIERDGSISWEMPWGGIHDLHLLPNGNYLVLEGAAGVAEIDPDSRTAVWRYNAAKQGDSGRRVEVHACQPLPGGNVMIAESGRARIIEVDREGKLLKEVPLTVESPDPHSDTRLARKLDNGNYLVAHEADGKVREYDGDSGDVVWEYAVPMFGKEPRGGHGPEAFGNRLFAAVRLENGNTLIATGNGHSVLEVTPQKKIVWQLHQNELESIRLAWVTTLEVLENGNLVIGNCHAGPDQPLLVEIEPKTKRVVWTLDRHQDFGNDVSNSLLLDAGDTIR